MVRRTRIRGSCGGRRTAVHSWDCLGWARDVRFDAGGSGAGGDEETRTPDPLLAKETLYQLSYVPAPGG
jgi:hypothetical protein